jgi:hypothetical protein
MNRLTVAKKLMSIAKMILASPKVATVDFTGTGTAGQWVTMLGDKDVQWDIYKALDFDIYWDYEDGHTGYKGYTPELQDHANTLIMNWDLSGAASPQEISDFLDCSEIELIKFHILEPEEYEVSPADANWDITLTLTRKDKAGTTVALDYSVDVSA